MLNSLPRKSRRISGETTLASLRATFSASRRIAAEKLQNPRILQIHFHTLCHWKATMLYHQTKDILSVMKFLGHKNIKNTLLYVQLAEVIFKEASDEFITRATKSVKGARALLEAGLDFVMHA